MSACVICSLDLDRAEIENILFGLDDRREYLKKELADCLAADWQVSSDSLRRDLQRVVSLIVRFESMLQRMPEGQGVAPGQPL